MMKHIAPGSCFLAGCREVTALILHKKTLMKTFKRFLDKILRHLYFNILVVFRIEFPAKSNRDTNEPKPENEV